MANPTSNFGWQMPTNTDLVKDLPADFEVFGQAVDTSLMDLKGGTTGQVLSKASNTDMDFTWVAQDDSNAIQNAIVDAKGDLISATAADTPARLAVGTNGQVLTADSTQSTGLIWATPAAGGVTVLASGSLSSSSLTLGSISGSYKNLRLVVRNARASATSNLPYVRINATSTAGSYILTSGVTTFATATATQWDLTGGNLPTSTNSRTFIIEFPNYSDSTGFKNIIYWESTVGKYGWGYQNTITGAITEVAFFTSGGGTFTEGTYELQGIK